jgi:hypothetical protein
MRRVITYTLLLLFATLATIEARGEKPIVSGRFSKDSIEVGDLVEYIIDIEADRATVIGVPDFDTTTPEERKKEAQAKGKMSTYETYDEDIFELIEDYPIDTLEVDGRRLHLRKRYLLATMETGKIPMRPTLLYFDKNRETPDTLYAEEMLYLNVKSYEELDTTLFLRPDPMSQQGFGVDTDKAMTLLKDEGINTQKNLPFIFGEIRDYVIYSAIAIILLALMLYLLLPVLKRYIAQRGAIVKPKPKMPPHIVAIKALEELKNRKLCENGKHKSYYTSLVSILKVYIDGRWDISVLDKTSAETMVALRDVELPRECRSNLIAILETADFVKFAKVVPEAETNEDLFIKAYYFVENTKAEESVVHDKKEINFETPIDE